MILEPQMKDGQKNAKTTIIAMTVAAIALVYDTATIPPTKIVTRVTISIPEIP
jgi:hypothetical protein